MQQPGWKQVTRRIELPDVVAAVGRLRGTSPDDDIHRRGDWGRPMVLLAARRLAGIKNRALAGWMGAKDESAVTHAVNRLDANMQSDRMLKRFYEGLRRALSNVKM